MRHRRLAPVLALLLVINVGPVQMASAQPGCDPFTTPPAFDPSVPTLADVTDDDIDFGEREVTWEESNAYLAAVATASPRVITDQAATSVLNKPIPYAVIGTEARLGDLPGVLGMIETLRNPDAATEEPEALAAALQNAPVILWIAGNVHGGEESGADAALQVLYHLAARTDCVVVDILANALVVILPVQNPDGRDLEQRRNWYGFDMNRDWFARTQPETDGKLEVIREYPPMLFIDAHEFGLPNYFFPPNADPEYHEIPDVAHDWINDLYSPAIANQFDAEGIKYFHGAPYDFFAIVFGDTVPTTGFHAAGMTFEKEGGDPIAVRTHEQFTSMWASLFAGATAREAVVQEWHASFELAQDQGEAGILEPNEVFERRHDLYQQVPNQVIRHYLIGPATEDRAYERQLLVRRLQRMDVDVYEITEPAGIDDFHPYGDDVSGGAVLAPGTLWIPLAQAEKHWIHAMLHEESWIPFDVTYDVTAWSNPLLMNLLGGWSGDATFAPPATLLSDAAEPEWTATTDSRVGIYEIPSTREFESTWQTRWLFDEVWNLDYDAVTAADIAAGLPDIDVLVIADGYANYALQELGAKGKKALRTWVNEGGRIVAWQGGAEVVAKAGASTAKFAGSHTNMPGTLVRVALDQASPLADGIGNTAWVMYLDDRTIAPGLGTSVATFPAPTDLAFDTSGLDIGVETLTGTSALVDEAVGLGRVISFSIDPNFRAWSQGTQRILWNAIAGPDPSAAPGLFAGSRERAAAEKAALDAALKLPDLGSAIRIRVARVDAAATAKIVQRRSSEVVRIDLGSETLFLIGNKKDLTFEEHPWFGLVIRELDQAGIGIRAASVP